MRGRVGLSVLLAGALLWPSLLGGLPAGAAQVAELDRGSPFPIFVRVPISISQPLPTRASQPLTVFRVCADVGSPPVCVVGVQKQGGGNATGSVSTTDGQIDEFTEIVVCSGAPQCPGKTRVEVADVQGTETLPTAHLTLQSVCLVVLGTEVQCTGPVNI